MSCRTPPNASQKYRSAVCHHLRRWRGDAESLEEGFELVESGYRHDDNGCEVHVVLRVVGDGRVFSVRSRFIRFPEANAAPIHGFRAARAALHLRISRCNFWKASLVAITVYALHAES